MTFKSIARGAIPVIAAIVTIALSIRYFGDKPLLEDVAKGLNGDVKGWFK